MTWRKLGLIFVPDGQITWMRSHAAYPQALHLAGSVFRVFFSTRDSEGRSHIAYLDLDVENPQSILALSSRPVLSPGPVGLFDDCGVIPSCVVQLPSGLAIFYIGISLSVTTPYTSFLGLAFLDTERESALRHSPSPLLDRTPDDPFSNGAAFVCPAQDHPGFDMWFESQNRIPEQGSSETLSVGLKYASSADGIIWDRSPRFVLPPPAGTSFLATPCVLPGGDGYRMWYSLKRRGRYSIGGAESADGVRWTRKDLSTGMLASGSGWDGEEVSYPNVFEYRGRLFMLYNGNGYGRTGFGIAILESQ